MSIPAVKGIYHDGEIKALEDIPYRKDMNVVIVFLEDTQKESMAWDVAAAGDFLKGYSSEDTVYDRL